MDSTLSVTLAPKVSFHRENGWTTSGRISPTLQKGTGQDQLGSSPWVMLGPTHHLCYTYSSAGVPQQGYSNSILLTLWLDNQSTVIWSHPMYCGSTCPLLITTKNASRHCQMSPEGKKNSWMRNTVLHNNHMTQLWSPWHRINRNTDHL